MSAAPMNVDAPGPVDTLVDRAASSVAAPTSELDELRAEVVRLRQANHRLIARFATAGRAATPPAGGEVAPATARASMARAAGDLRREVERTVQVRDHLSREWAALHAAKVRLRATWEEIERRRDIVLAREAELVTRHEELVAAESEVRARRHTAGRQMAALARVLDETLVDPAGVVARNARVAARPTVEMAEPVTPSMEPPTVDESRISDEVWASGELGPIDASVAAVRLAAPAPHGSIDGGSGAMAVRSVGAPAPSGSVLVGGLVDMDGDHEEQARFDRFFSEEIETEPSRTWLES